MAIAHVNIDLSTLNVLDLLTYDNFLHNSTHFEVYNDLSTDYVDFTGNNLQYSFDSNQDLTGITGTVTGVTSVSNGFTQFTLTDANVSAQQLYNLVVAGKTTAVFKLFLSGDDTIYGSAANDTLHGYGGNDKIFGYSGADHLFGDLGNDTLIGGGGNNVLNGGAGNDVLKGGGAKDILHGQAGHDILHGYVGNDVLFGEGGGDIIHGEAGADKAFGGAGADRILGEAGNDTLLGGPGQDTIVGGKGSDVIKGQGGADFLRGNAGHDNFVFTSLDDSRPGAGHDVIADFQQGIDHINVLAIDANDNTGDGNQSFNFIGIQGFHGIAGELRYHILANGHTVIAADVDGDSSPDFAIQLNTTVHLLASDIFGAT